MNSFYTLLLAACLAKAAAGASATNRFEFQQPQMGLPFRIVLYAEAEADANAAAAAAFARIAELNSILSDYEDESELSRLSRSSGQGQAIAVSPDMWVVLQQAQQFWQQSGGAFDITVGPIVQLWRRARRQRELPAPERITEALGRCGFQNVQLDATARTALLKVPGMQLDAGAIAKGYAVDEALKVLQARGVRSALVAGGGDLAVSAAPPERPGWKIDIAPAQAGSPAGHVLLTNSALATSGDTFQRLELNGQRYSHILDPRTGMALTNSSLVTVISTNCATADSLATAVSVLGPSNGLALIGRTPGAQARIVYHDSADLKTIESAGWHAYRLAPEN